MIMVLPTMFRDTQNRYEPNLPFAQSLSPLMFRDNQNPDTPNLPFSQTRRQESHDYMVKGDIPFPAGLGKIDGVKRFTESNANNYRRMGYSVVLIGDTGGTTIPKPPKPPKPPLPIPTGSGLTRTQVENIIESYHGDDIALLHSHAVNFGKTISTAKLHRDSIEGKVETGIAARDKIHNTLSDLGRSVSDVSNALSVHSTHDLIPNPLGDILPYVLIGGVALLAMRKR